MKREPYAIKAEAMPEVARLYRDGWSAQQIAERLNVAKSTVQSALSYLGVPARGRYESRALARTSGFHEWKRERRTASAFLAQTLAHWRT